VVYSFLHTTKDLGDPGSSRGTLERVRVDLTIYSVELILTPSLFLFTNYSIFPIKLCLSLPLTPPLFGAFRFPPYLSATHSFSLYPICFTSHFPFYIYLSSARLCLFPLALYLNYNFFLFFHNPLFHFGAAHCVHC
jgi:hypothetical protein